MTFSTRTPGEPRRIAGLDLLRGTALAGLGVLSVIPLRGHALTYLAGGPAIAALTAVLPTRRTWTRMTPPPLRAATWLGTVSYGAYLRNLRRRTSSQPGAA